MSDWNTQQMSHLSTTQELQLTKIPIRDWNLFLKITYKLNLWLQLTKIPIRDWNLLGNSGVGKDTIIAINQNPY